MDLLCWMALASRALATIASSIAIPKSEVRGPVLPCTAHSFPVLCSHATLSCDMHIVK